MPTLAMWKFAIDRFSNTCQNAFNPHIETMQVQRHTVKI